MNNQEQDIEDWRKEVADVKPLLAELLQPSSSPIDTLPALRSPKQQIKRRQTTFTTVQMAVRYPNYERETPTMRLVKIDASIMRQLRLDRLPITHKLDLHDMSLAVAYDVLHNFLRLTMQDGAKIALVITGKGSTGGIGELRRNLPRWCIEPIFQPMVVALQQAYSHHGGVGAFYVQIRRG